MLADEVRERDFELDGNKIRDSIFFKIEEKIEEFFSDDRPIKSIKIPPLITPLPYNNIVLLFKGCRNLFWYIQELTSESLSLKISIFDPNGFLDKNLKIIEPYYFLSWKRSFLLRNDLDSFEVLDGFQILPLHLKDEFLDNIEHDKIFLEILISYALLEKFICFLSCKNITTELNQPDEKLQKARIKRGKLPLISYYTLKLQIPSREGQGSDSKGLWTNRIHLCRGHMREYTADAPMFGMLVGKYWIWPHVRGNKKNGVIVKDYQIDKKIGQEETEDRRS